MPRGEVGYTDWEACVECEWFIEPSGDCKYSDAAIDQELRIEGDFVVCGLFKEAEETYDNSIL
jgi:hypothetical protein